MKLGLSPNAALQDDVLQSAPALAPAPGNRRPEQSLAISGPDRARNAANRRDDFKPMASANYANLPSPHRRVRNATGLSTS